MILPGAEAMMSILPKQAQASAKKKMLMIVRPMARPIGDGGVSTISSAAGRKASSALWRRPGAPGKETVGLADFMQSALDPVERGIAAARPDQLGVRSIFDKAATIDGENAVAAAHR